MGKSIKASNNRGFRSFLFIMSVAVLAMALGIYTEREKVFPHGIVTLALAAASATRDRISGKKSIWYIPTEQTELSIAHRPKEMAAGLTKITSVNIGHPTLKTLSVRIVDRDGGAVHIWIVDWFDLWPDATHVSAHLRPMAFRIDDGPAVQIHGAEILPNGDLVFNFEELGLLRLDACGNIIWRLPYLTHHSVFVDDKGNIWVSGTLNQHQALKEIPIVNKSFLDQTLLKVSPEGKILREIKLLELFEDNELPGFAFMSRTFGAEVNGDVFHLNDVEVFPSTLEEGFFKHGDIMFSLRNINAIFVIDSETLRIKYSSVGKAIRQHDPDFVDGYRFSFFDNNHKGSPMQGIYSRILVEDVRTGRAEEVFIGSKDIPFYSWIMGKHQWLDNGNLLVSSSTGGRVFELNEARELVWEFNNITAPGYLGIVQEAERLPKQYDRAFFEKKRVQCQIN